MCLSFRSDSICLISATVFVRIYAIKYAFSPCKKGRFRKLFICISVLFACNMDIICVSGTRGGQKRVSDLLELELRMVVSHHVDAGN